MLKTIAIAAAIFGGLAAPAVLATKPAAAPQPGGKAESQQVATSQSFAPTCSADAKITDSRVEPAWVGQSYAGDGCAAPSLPKYVNGYAATRAQVLAGMAAQKKYIVQADVYQRCIADYVTARRAAATKGARPMDVALTVIENHRITASEASKQKAAEQVKLTVAAFNEAGSEDCK